MGSHECPSCGSKFDTRRGLGVHHAQAHGSRLPNHTCEQCGERFHSEYQKKYCSEECLRAAVSFAGSDNPNYRGGKETTECVLCGRKFEFYPSEKKGLFCPDCVQNADWRTLPDIVGESNPNWIGGKRELECAVCGTTVRRYPSDATGEVCVCSEDCRRKWLSDSFTGEGHPNWKGGDNGAYGKGCNAVRRAALERDDHECVVCGKTKEDVGRNPDVHHIVPVRWFVESEDHERADAHRLENVVTLCVRCHRKADFGKISADRLRGLIESEC